MKNIFYAVGFGLMLFSCQNQSKIGFVDNGVVINDYQEKKDVEAKFQERDAAFRIKADSLGKAFQKEVQDVQTEAQRATQAKAQELMSGLQKKQQQLQQQMQFEQQQLQMAFQAEIDSVIGKVKTYVKEYGKNNGYTYVLGTSDAAATVMYGAQENDLTNTILEALNKAYSKE
ncbi:OmpH family outer membrane protein [Gaetbulibacter saemankumensis]|uniref:OmpH family outer membrane protein n=1 Tax=Gaetbulibacter saemankumensis TaxID=311208 RepID=UPI0004018A8C|nr:OmpH family outer membrane protein [Gaetbulibacter saemankumensis]